MTEREAVTRVRGLIDDALWRRIEALLPKPLLEGHGPARADGTHLTAEERAG